MGLIATTIVTLELLLKRSTGTWMPLPAVPSDGTWGILSTQREDVVCLVSPSDAQTAPLILIDPTLPAGRTLESDDWRAVFQRVCRVAELSRRRQTNRLPPGWRPYQTRNLVAFFAHGEVQGAIRWIVEVGPEKSEDIAFWRLTSPDSSAELDTFEAPDGAHRRLAQIWRTEHPVLIAALSRSSPVAPSIQSAFALDVVDFESVLKGNTYSMWLPKLQQPQKVFIEAAIPHALKLKGPAGSGKTLCLALKALRQLYESEQSVRIAVITHSWATAEDLDSLLRGADERGRAAEIEVAPLLWFAQSLVPPERRAAGFDLLGEDSLSGRRAQLARIDDIVDSFQAGDWIALRRAAGAQLRTRVDAPHGSPERNTLVWDLMNEFSSVLAQHKVLPGPAGERQYKALGRGPWMMRLDNEIDRKFVLQIYDQYLVGLKTDRLMTSDQLTSDFLSYLETFAWNLRRGDEGYDVIFVDELHLFSEPERLALQRLTRSAAEYPRLVMALDPRQSPAEVYTEFKILGAARAESGSADDALGEISAFDLTTVHRFSPQILALVKHVHLSYPALDLGPDWAVAPEALESAAEAGPVPAIGLFQDRHAQMAATVEWARISTSRSGRGAVVVFDREMVVPVAGALRAAGLGVSTVESRDDFDQARYSPKSTVVGTAEHLAGLQFDRVILVGGGATPGEEGTPATMRRILSALYVGITRGKLEVAIFYVSGELPAVLDEAINVGLAVRYG